MRVHKIVPHKLSTLSGGSSVYCSKNPLVRWLNWIKLDKLLTLAPHPIPHSCVLDLGCGNGVLLPSLCERYNMVFGLDIDPEAVASCLTLAHLNDLSNVIVHSFKGPKFPFNSKSFDIVFAASVLEHCRDLHKVASEIHRVLLPGGCLVYVSPTEGWLYRLGRLVCGYTKPVDHYHTGLEIEEVLGQYFKKEVAINFPLLPVYRMGRFKKE